MDRAPEIDMSELENLFSSASLDANRTEKGAVRKGPIANKPEIVHLVYQEFILFNAVNHCENILLSM